MPMLASLRRLVANVSGLRETRAGIRARQSGSTAPAPEFSLDRQLAATHSAQPFLQHVDPDFLSPFYFIMVMIRHTYQ